MPTKSDTEVQELKIGPYSGGINQYSDQSAIGDDELVDCVNFDIDLDGSLKSRPPWSLLYSESGTEVTGTVPPESHQLILGTFVYGGVEFVIFNSNHEGFYASWILYIGGPFDGEISKIADGTYSGAVRYVNDVYLCPGPEGGDESLGTGQKYDLAGGVVTSIPNMPRGYASTIYKDRFWISGRRDIINNSRLFFSDLADFEVWPSVNFFDINVGDGDAVNELLVYQDNLMIFKDNATYVLSYDQGPAQAVLQVVNTEIGAMGAHCVAAYENSIFILQYNIVYEMVNYDFTRVSVKIPFEYDDTVPLGDEATVDQSWKYAFHLSLVGDRLVVRFYNRTYVYHLRLRAWTRWNSLDENINYMGPILQLDNTNTDEKRGFESYVAGSALAKTPDADGFGVAGGWKKYLKIFIMEDLYEADNIENGNITETPVNIELLALTKTYDMGLSHRFKRLMHWGVDTITGSEITGTVYPFSIAYKVTWAQLHIYRWHELNTWGYPLFEIPSVSQSQPVGAGLARRFIRFPKSLRFRLIQFKVEMTTTGNNVDGPARLYSITAFISGKQLAPRAVN